VAQSYWSVFFSVADADAAAAKVRELGGTLVREPFDSPHGRMAPCTDPAGAQVTLCRLP
jgi:predicted enzyme related to lactoylglutathione lyase